VCQSRWKFLSGRSKGAYRCRAELVSKLSSLLQNNFYCYQSKKAEDTVKKAKFELTGQNRFFSEHNEI